MRSIVLTLTLALVTACEAETPSEDPTPAPVEEPVAAPDMTLVHDGPLTDLAKEALAVAPSWLRDDLAVSLGKLHEGLQETYANLILDAPEPRFIDEIAFVVAHLSPEVLASTNFYPELITLNAELVYARDADLDYVTIDDVGVPGQDDDFYTTTTYRTATVTVDEATGDETVNISENTIDKETYYWFVVHPRGEDERPYFIDPLQECAGGQCPTTPENGLFWREYLWTAQDDDCPDGVVDCPMLRDMLTGQDLLWKGRYGDSSDNGAMGQIMQWVNASMHFGALEERSVQPVRIYELHHGNCGEHGDITNAAARIGLIPGIVIEARGNDHCWSEFWDMGWVQVEPVNTSIDYYGYYADADGNYFRTLNGIDDDCDGVADLGESEADDDGDGYTVAGGDCDDTNADVNPGAAEIANARDDDCDGALETTDTMDSDADGDGWSPNAGDCDDTNAAMSPDGAEGDVDGLDNDCDGVVDDGLGEADVDGDGHTVLAGDCDDTRADVNPDAIERSNTRDDNCDGAIDEDLPTFLIDRDGDGSGVVGGDCNDMRAGTNPAAPDPAMSTNRLFGLTGGRGDAWVMNRTEPYVNTFDLVINVMDADGRPVDGAVITVFGWSTTYANAAGWWVAHEMVTGPDGVALRQYGEANQYGIQVRTPWGSFPADENQLTPVVEWTVAGETVEYDVTMPFSLEAAPAIEEVTLQDVEKTMTVTSTWQVTGGRVAGTSRLLHDSFSHDWDGAALDHFVLDQWGYARFAAGEDASALMPGVGATGQVDTELPQDRGWYVVFANHEHASTTVVGSAEVSVAALGIEWQGDAPDPISLPLRIKPGDHVAIRIGEDAPE